MELTSTFVLVTLFLGLRVLNFLYPLDEDVFDACCRTIVVLLCVAYGGIISIIVILSSILVTAGAYGTALSITLIGILLDILAAYQDQVPKPHLNQTVQDPLPLQF